MTDGERQAFTEALAQVAVIHGRELNALAVAGYWQVLRPYPLEDVLAALEAVLQTVDRFPAPSHLIDLLAGRVEDIAAEEWARVEEALSAVGTYASVDFGDDATHQIIHEWGGWAGLGRKLSVPEREYGFLRREFIQRYAALVRRPPRGAPVQLLGIHALENAGTAGQWTRGAGHVGTVQVLGDGGRVVGTRALGAPRSTGLARPDA